MEMTELSQKELIEVNGGTDNCPAQKDRGAAYYLGYCLGWLFD